MECNQIRKLVKKRSTNNSKSSELFNVDVFNTNSRRTNRLHDQNDLKLTFDFSDSTLNDQTSEKTQLDKKRRAQQERLEKKRIALEKKIARQKEREAKEAKKLQREQMRKYCKELKSELNKYACVLPQSSDSNTSLANNFDQVLLYKPKSIMFGQSVYSLNTKQNGSYMANYQPIVMQPYDYSDSKYGFNSSNLISTQLEPFVVNSNQVNTFNESVNYINYGFDNNDSCGFINNNSTVSDQSGTVFNVNIPQVGDFFINDMTYEQNRLEMINYDSSQLTYENLEDVNCSLLTDLNISVDLIGQDLNLF